MVNARIPRKIALDLRGLKCPLPVLRARRALTTMRTGDVLVVEATDPMSAIDIPHMVNETGDVLLDHSATMGVLSFRIEKR